MKNLEEFRARVGEHHEYAVNNVQTVKTILKTIALLGEDSAESKDIDKLVEVAQMYCDQVEDNVHDYRGLTEEGVAIK